MFSYHLGLDNGSNDSVSILTNSSPLQNNSFCGVPISVAKVPEMSYRVHKQPRQNRWALLEQQEQLISAKKKEIEERLKADQEKASQAKDSAANPSSSKNDQNQVNFANKFANDGSFFKIFEKMEQKNELKGVPGSDLENQPCVR